MNCLDPVFLSRLFFPLSSLLPFQRYLSLLLAAVDPSVFNLLTSTACCLAWQAAVPPEVAVFVAQTAPGWRAIESSLRATMLRVCFLFSPHLLPASDRCGLRQVHARIVARAARGPDGELAFLRECLCAQPPHTACEGKKEGKGKKKKRKKKF